MIINILKDCNAEYCDKDVLLLTYLNIIEELMSTFCFKHDCNF